MGVPFPDIDLPVGWSAGNAALGGEFLVDQDYFAPAAAISSAAVIEATRDVASAVASAAGSQSARNATAALTESSRDTAIVQARTLLRATAAAADRSDTAVSAARLLARAAGVAADSSDAALAQARVMPRAAAAIAESSADRAAAAAIACVTLGGAPIEPTPDSGSSAASVKVRAHAATAELGDVAVAQAFLAIERVVSAALVESGTDRVAGVVGWPAVNPAADTDAGGLGLAPRRGGTWSVPQPWNGSPLPHAAPIPASVRRRPRADALLLTPL